MDDENKNCPYLNGTLYTTIDDTVFQFLCGSDWPRLQNETYSAPKYAANLLDCVDQCAQSNMKSNPTPCVGVTFATTLPPRGADVHPCFLKHSMPGNGTKSRVIHAAKLVATFVKARSLDLQLIFRAHLLIHRVRLRRATRDRLPHEMSCETTPRLRQPHKLAAIRSWNSE